MKLGPYEVIEEVGRGGFGLVFRARGPDGAEVAVKVLRSATVERSARFERETRLLRELGAGFVPFLDAGESAEGAYLVMPFLRGGTLRDRFRHGPLPVAETVAIGRALAEALARAHARGVVHRDLKPENVIFTEAGEPLIADLGLGKHVAAAGAESVALTKTHEIRGTAGYAAPEQVRRTKDAGPPADVFALGAILYECLAGHAAFEGPNALALIVAAENGNLEPLSKERPDAPAFLVKAIERALDPDPAARFADAAALLRALTPPAAKKGPRAAVILGAGLALLALAALGAVVATRSPEAAPAELPTVAKPSPGDPAEPKPSDPPPRIELPALCSGFRETPHTRLAQVLGSYEWTSAREVVAAAFSPEGEHAITASKEAARIFACPSGREERVLDGSVSAVALGPRGEVALCVVEEKDRARLVLWTASGTEEVPTPSRPTAVAIAPDGSRALIGCVDGAIEVRELPSGAHALQVLPRGPAVASVAFGADRDHAASVSEDGYVLLHGAEGATPLETPVSPGGRVVFSGDGKLLLLLGARVARVHDAATHALLRKHDADAKVTGGGFTADGQVFTVSGTELRIWDRAGSEPLDLAHATKVVAGSRDGRMALAGCFSSVYPFDLGSRKQLVAFEGHRSHVTTIAPVGSSSRVLTAGYDGRVVVWQLETGRETAVLGDHHRIVYAVAVTPDGELALSTGSDRKVKVWEVATGRFLREYAGHGHVVHAVAVSARGLAASAGLTAKIHLWDTATAGRGILLNAGRGSKDDDVNFLEFLADGRLVSACTDGRLLLWDMIDRFRSTVVTSLTEPVTALAVCRPRGTLVVGTKSGRLLAVQLSGQGEPRVLDAQHREEVFSVAVSPDARTVASGGGKDSRVFLSDFETGRIVDTIDLASSRDFVHSVAWTPDGRSVLVGTLRGVVLRFEVR